MVCYFNLSKKVLIKQKWGKHKPNDNWNRKKAQAGGWDFSKMAVMGDGKSLLEIDGKPGMRGRFYNGGMGSF